MAFSIHGICFQLPPPLLQRHKEDIAPDVFAEDRQQLRAADLGQPRSLNVARPGNAEARVAGQEVIDNRTRWSPARPTRPLRPASERSASPCLPGASCACSAPQSGFRPDARVPGEANPRPPSLPLQRRVGQHARPRGRILLFAPEEGLRGRVIFPQEGDGFYYCVVSSRLSKGRENRQPPI